MKPHSRRQTIIERMETLEAQGQGCQGCSGTCCTYEANSMMVTPLEAFDLLAYLKSEKILDDGLKQKIRDSIKNFRLDHPTGNGRKSYLRRSYTCPFFNHKELGCPLPREVKPYGCLAFNSHHATEKAGIHCYSEREILEKRERLDPNEASLNKKLIQKYDLIWDKSPLPTALLDIWNLNPTDADLGLD